MPDEAKKEIRAARVNVILFRYIAIIVLAFLFLLMLLGGSYIVLGRTQASAEMTIDANNTKADVFSSTKAEVDALSSSLSEARNILDQEILYSNVLINIGQQMPEGTVLERIALNSASFTGTPVSLKAYAVTNDAALALRERFQSSPFFTNVNFESVSETAGGIPGYPVSVSMTVTITRAAAQ